jgi:hypothetical protein
MKKKIGLFGGGNSLIKRSYLIEIGGIDRTIHWGADFFWAQKLKEKGYQVMFYPDPLYHDTMKTFLTFLKKQIHGAKTFSTHGFESMGLSTSDVIYEHFVLGIKKMMVGIFINKDHSWCYYPLVLITRGFVYFISFLKRGF